MPKGFVGQALLSFIDPVGFKIKREMVMKKAGVFALVLLCSLNAMAKNSTSRLTVQAISGKQGIAPDITRLALNVRIHGFMAQTVMSLSLANTTDNEKSFTLRFDMPRGAIINGYAAGPDGKAKNAVIMKNASARLNFPGGSFVHDARYPGAFTARTGIIAPHDTSTVVIRFLNVLPEEDGMNAYRLPLRFDHPLDFDLSVIVIAPPGPPEVEKSPSGIFDFSKKHEDFHARTSAEGITMNNNLIIAVPAVDTHSVMVENAGDGTCFFAARLKKPGIAPAAGGKPRHIAILWDASDSRAYSHASEIYMLTSYMRRIRRYRLLVDMTVFRDRPGKPRRYIIRNGDARRMLSDIESFLYDGGTQTGMLPGPLKSVPDLYIMFSDGLLDFGKEKPGPFDAPLFTVTGDRHANTALLGAAAAENGGEFFNLRRVYHAKAARLLGRKIPRFVCAHADSQKVWDIYPRRPRPAGSLVLTGRIMPGRSQITVDYAMGKKIVKQQDVIIDTRGAVDEKMIRAYRNMEKINDLGTCPVRNEKEMFDLACKNGILIPGTCFGMSKKIVHDNADDGEGRRKISGPAICSKGGIVRKKNGGQPGKIIELWNERVAWWSGIKKKMSSGTNAGAPDNAAGIAEQTRITGKHPGRIPKSPAMLLPLAAAACGPVQATHRKIKSWTSNARYLKDLKRAWNPRARFAAYMRNKVSYANAPSFYLECSEFFRMKNQPLIAVQVLSNIAELGLDSPEALKIMAYRLMRLGRFKTAKIMLKKVLEKQPADPRSWRDLALLFDDSGDYTRALKMYDHIISMNLSGKEAGAVAITALEEMNALAAVRKTANRDLQTGNFDPGLVKLLDFDIRAVLTWDRGGCDVDLFVIEPSGEKCTHLSPVTADGGRISSNIKDGYGPEEYCLRSAPDGTWKFLAVMKSSSATHIYGPVSCRLDIFTNFGRVNQEHRVITTQLSEKNRPVEIGDVTLGRKHSE